MVLARVKLVSKAPIVAVPTFLLDVLMATKGPFTFRYVTPHPVLAVGLGRSGLGSLRMPTPFLLMNGSLSRRLVSRVRQFSPLHDQETSSGPDGAAREDREDKSGGNGGSSGEFTSTITVSPFVMDLPSMLTIQEAQKRTFPDAMEAEGEEEEVCSPCLCGLNLLRDSILPLVFLGRVE